MCARSQEGCFLVCWQSTCKLLLHGAVRSWNFSVVSNPNWPEHGEPSICCLYCHNPVRRAPFVSYACTKWISRWGLNVKLFPRYMLSYKLCEEMYYAPLWSRWWKLQFYRHFGCTSRSAVTDTHSMRSCLNSISLSAQLISTFLLSCRWSVPSFKDPFVRPSP